MNNNTFKVIHILNELKYSGAEIMYVDAAETFQSLGCELTVVATAKELGEYAPNFQKAGYKVLHKPFPKRTNFLARIIFVIRFVRFLKTGKYNVVHNHSSNTFWYMALCARIAGIKSVYTFHNVFPTNWYSKYYHILKRYTAKVWFGCKFQTISDSVYENELRVFKNETTKIYNWYGSNRFYPDTDNEKQKFRAELQIPTDSLVLISVGGCSHIKRHSEILKALALIVKQYPNSIYLHLGKGETEPSEIQLALELSVNEHVRFCGNQSDVRKYLIASDLYLMTSLHEGIPITTIEAMACGIPAILYDVPGLRDFNRTGENSLLIPEDYKLLYENVIMLYNDTKRAKKMASNAKTFVDNTFNMHKNATKIFNLYK